jgi:hypothetical protein
VNLPLHALALLLCAIPLIGCVERRASTPDDPLPITPTEAPSNLAGDTDPQTIVLGPWADYPEPEDEEWPLSPLSVSRWAVASAELACAGRAFQGDPKRQRSASNRILHHHATTGAEVMAFGIELNGQPERAQRLGDLVAAAAEICH